jgi:adenylate kinase family enzyme
MLDSEGVTPNPPCRNEFRATGWSERPCKVLSRTPYPLDFRDEANRDPGLPRKRQIDPGAPIRAAAATAGHSPRCAVLAAGTWPDIPACRARVAEAIAGEAWISDGNYVLTTFDLILPRADAIIILERPRWLCLGRVLWRTLSRRSRPDLPGGCREQLDWDLIKVTWSFETVSRPRLDAARIVYGSEVPVIRLRSEREINDFLANQPQPPS